MQNVCCQGVLMNSAVRKIRTLPGRKELMIKYETQIIFV